MNKQFISISDAVTRYKISQTKLRKIVKELNGTEHVKQVEITGRHGFKYLISVTYLDTLFNVVNEPKKDVKSEINIDSLHDVLINQLTNENKQLNKQINKQFETIQGLTNTLQEQQKVVIAQSLQISRLSEPNHRPNDATWNEPNDNKKMLTIELLIISILVVCIVAVIAYLFR